MVSGTEESEEENTAFSLRGSEFRRAHGTCNIVNYLADTMEIKESFADIGLHKVNIFT